VADIVCDHCGEKINAKYYNWKAPWCLACVEEDGHLIETANGYWGAKQKKLVAHAKENGYTGWLCSDNITAVMSIPKKTKAPLKEEIKEEVKPEPVIDIDPIAIVQPTLCRRAYYGTECSCSKCQGLPLPAFAFKNVFGYGKENVNV
jgi:thiol-disulfide isomerase/thioredoxin